MPTNLFRWVFVSIIKMLEYDKIDISEGIDVNKTNESKECMLCHYWYFLNKNFNYGPYLCHGCYSIAQKSVSFKNIKWLQRDSNPQPLSS